MPAPSALTLIDTVDEADRPIGKIERSRVFAVGAKFRVVHIFDFDTAGWLLLQQLGRHRERNPLKWGSSVAGYLHSGETYVEGAARRLREELGLSTPLMKHGSFSMQDEKCLKFLTLYTTRASDPRIQEPQHIEKLEFRPIGEIEERLRTNPGEFTETFRRVFSFYLATRQLDRTTP